MPVWAWILIAVGAVAIIGLVAWSAVRSSRTSRLRDRFGTEYDRTVDAAPKRREAEAELEERRRRRQQLDIRPLDPATRERYARAWTETQSRFVDSPSESIREADVLVVQVMRDRGYPTEDFEQRTADVSVDHPEVVQNYRAAHEISRANDQGGASTEDLRRAMVHYRALFEDLLVDTDDTPMRRAR